MNVFKKVIIIGAGGSGKDYLAKYLGKKLKRNIAYTTRPMRDGEVDGEDYNFISIEDFEQKIQENFWHEYNTFIPEKRWYYGSSRENFEKCQLFIKEPYAVSQLSKEEREQSLIVYINIDENIRRERMLSRKKNDDSVERRIEGDRKDFDNFTDYDMLVVNPYFNCEKISDEIISLLSL